MAADTVSPSRQRRKEARPQQLLDAALALFVEKGFAATRSDEVARAAGVAKGTLYLYYPSKEELFKAVVRHNVSGLLSEVEALVARYEGGTPELLRNLRRIPGHGENVAELKGRKILVDGKAGELLLQIFSENQLGPIFFEFIQRKGDQGFGEGNFKALFESMELDQMRRGVLEKA